MVVGDAFALLFLELVSLFGVQRLDECGWEYSDSQNFFFTIEGSPSLWPASPLQSILGWGHFIPHCWTIQWLQTFLVLARGGTHRLDVPNISERKLLSWNFTFFRVGGGVLSRSSPCFSMFLQHAPLFDTTLDCEFFILTLLSYFWPSLNILGCQQQWKVRRGARRDAQLTHFSKISETQKWKVFLCESVFLILFEKFLEWKKGLGLG